MTTRKLDPSSNKRCGSLLHEVCRKQRTHEICNNLRNTYKYLNIEKGNFVKIIKDQEGTTTKYSIHKEAEKIITKYAIEERNQAEHTRTQNKKLKETPMHG